MLKYGRKIVTVLQGGFKMKRLSIVFLIAMCWHQARGDIWDVPSRGNPTIQSAVNNANNGDTIIVSPGSYRENINFLGKAVTLRSQDPNNPSIVAATIIDGNQPADPNKGSVVTFSSGEKNNSVLTGFTITGGTGSWLPIAWDLHQVYWNRCGGGAVCYNMSEPTISKNVFVNNIAGQGGGIYVYGDPVNPANPSDPNVHVRPIITNNTFTGNSAIVGHGFVPPNSSYPNGDHGDGGAIVGFQGCDAVITGNTIQSNSADLYGGGIHVRQWSNGLIENNLISKNTASLGGGIHITYTSSPALINNTISDNKAGTLGGGGIYIMFESSPTVERNIISNNSSQLGAAIAIFELSEPMIQDNFIIKNSNGCSIYIQQSTPQIQHNTIADNSVPSLDGAIDCRFSSFADIKENIISSNGAGFGVYFDSSSGAAISYNNIWDNKAGSCYAENPNKITFEANISFDPDFLSADSNDYHLNYSSKCINAGDPNSGCALETDIDRQPRKMGSVTDIGADEAVPVWNITAGEQYLTIQQAIDDANGNETIVATQGRFLENIDFKGKAVILRSIDPNDWSVVEKTVIDGNNGPDNYGTTVSFTSGEDINSILAGFTITGGYNPTTSSSSSGYGGGIQCYGHSSPTIYHNKIMDNFADTGAGISLYHSSVILKSNIICSNTGLEYSLGGGLSIIDCEAPVIVNNLIAGNKSFMAPGIFLVRSQSTIINNTVVFNRSYSNYAVNGIYIESFNDTIRNCIFWNEGDDVWRAVGGSEVKYCCIEDGDAGEGNISTDPNFVNPGFWNDAGTPGNPADDFFVMGDYHITRGSGCIDAGDNNSVPALLQTDIDGEGRIYNNRVDIGAYEVVIHPMDINNDGIVDCYELRILTEEWLHSGRNLRTDFHNDDFVDFHDFAELANHWLSTDSRSE